MSRFVALHPSEEALTLLATLPNAWLLLCQIAMRAKWKDDPIRKLTAGEAFIGDWKEAGLKSEQTYRTAKKQLQDNGLATFRATNKGTVAKLAGSTIFSLSADSANEQNDGKPTGQQQANNDPANRPTTTNHTENTEYTENEEMLPFQSSQFRETWNAWKSYRASRKLSLTAKWKAAELKKFGQAGEDASIASIRTAIEQRNQGSFPKAQTQFVEPSEWEEMIGVIFGRSPGEKWTLEERTALQALGQIPEASIETMRSFYHAEIPERDDHRRRSLLTLLRNWPGEMDKARAYTPSLL